MAEAIGVFSGIISLAGLLYQIKQSHEQRKVRVIKSFESELKDFVNNVLGWYNQIISFSYPLLEDLKLGRFSVKKQKEYFKILNTIKRSDVYYSKCQQFIDEGLKRYEKEAILSSRQVKASIQQLVVSYRQFSGLVFYHKDKLGYLLWQWKSMSRLDRKTEVHRVEDDLERIEAFKNAAVLVLSIKIER